MGQDKRGGGGSDHYPGQSDYIHGLGAYPRLEKSCRTLLHMHTKTCMCGAPFHVHAAAARDGMH